MLVLTRKEEQKVLIPGLDISIKVICCKNSSVRLGIDAPPEIRIIRDELESGFSITDPDFTQLLDEKVDSFPIEQRHDVRDQFNVLTIAMQMLLDDIDAGVITDPGDIFDSIRERLHSVKATPNDQNAFVLVVEDHANERELLAGVLRMNGYRVATAADGNEALEYMEDHGIPSFILVDMQMPGCDGKELIERMRSSTDLRDVRIYMVSGCDEKDSGVSAHDIDGWYSKPLEPQKLLKAMAVSAG